MLKDTAERVQSVAPLCGDFAVICAQEYGFILQWLFTVIGFLISTSVLGFASAPKMLIQVPQDNLMVWIQTEGLDFFKLVADRPWSFLTMVTVTAFVVRMTFLGTSFYSKLTSEHNEVRKKLGLVPQRELTEDEKKEVVLTASDLDTAISKQTEWINKRFVPMPDYMKNQSEIQETLQKILNRGQRVRKSDNNGDEN